LLPSSQFSYISITVSFVEQKQEKDATQLYVKSFELGVLMRGDYTPSTFSVTPSHWLLGGSGADSAAEKKKTNSGADADAYTDAGTAAVGAAAVGAAGASDVAPLPRLPFRIPAPRYIPGSGDKPWSWESNYNSNSSGSKRDRKDGNRGGDLGCAGPDDFQRFACANGECSVCMHARAASSAAL
jgi:hypothetical protein